MRLLYLFILVIGVSTFFMCKKKKVEPSPPKKYYLEAHFRDTTNKGEIEYAAVQINRKGYIHQVKGPNPNEYTGFSSWDTAFVAFAKDTVVIVTSYGYPTIRSWIHYEGGDVYSVEGNGLHRAQLILP